jgi:hypothetical protein
MQAASARGRFWPSLRAFIHACIVRPHASPRALMRGHKGPLLVIAAPAGPLLNGRSVVNRDAGTSRHLPECRGDFRADSAPGGNGTHGDNASIPAIYFIAFSIADLFNPGIKLYGLKVRSNGIRGGDGGPRPGRIRLASERDKPVDKRGLVDEPRRRRATPGSASASLVIHYQPIPFVLQANKFPNPRRGLDYARQIMLPEFGYYFFNAFLIWVPTARARRIGESMR